MNQLSRKIWWYSIAVPRKLKSLWYHYAGAPKQAPYSFIQLSSEELNITFQDYYFSYAYYFERVIFSNGMGSGELQPLLEGEEEPSPQFNPILVALEALVSHNLYLTNGAKQELENFNRACRFLKKYAVSDQGSIWFPYYFDYSKYGMKAPWVSGLTQALVLSVFLREDQKDRAFLDGILNSLLLPIEEGGVLTQHPSGYPWIAEYPAEVPFVLNGQLSVIIGLLEYLHFFPQTELQNMVIKMINGFFADHSEYIFDKEMKYCWTKSKLASIHYKGLHAFQLIHLHQLTKIKAFNTLAKDWTPKVKWHHFARFHDIEQTSTLEQQLRNGLNDHSS